MSVIIPHFGADGTESESPPEVSNPQGHVESKKRRDKRKGREKTASLVKGGLSVNQRFPRRATVIASGQREREHEG